MQHETLWGRQEPHPSYPTLDRDIETSTLVVGGGITGLATARVLQERGHDVTVLEMHRVGLGTTGYSSGHLDITTDTGMDAVVSAFGVDAATRAVNAAKRALDRAERWSTDHPIDCDLRRVAGYMYTESNDRLEQLAKEAEAYSRAATSVQRLPSAPLPFATLAAIRFPDQIRFDPLGFTRGLASLVAADGGQVHEGTRVRRIHDHREGATIETSSAKIRAKHLVLATHAPLFGFMSMQTRAHPYQSYLVAVRVRDDIEDALYWDQMEPYHYTRILRSDDPRVILIGGADHRTGDERDTASRFDKLESYARSRYDVESVVGRWSAEFFEPADKLPYVGKLPGRHSTYIATGFSGDGLCWGMVSAEMIADAIEGREHALRDVLTPARIKPATAAGEMASAGLNIAKHAVGDHLAFADVDRLEEIPSGQGRLIRLGTQRLAVYRDDGGSLHAMSPVCRHAGCIVQWNEAASTWDCPCHGGRYDAYGKVIAAPPKQDLPRRDLD